MTLNPLTYDALIGRCVLPRLEARLLLSQASGQRREWLISHGDSLADGDVVDKFEHLCALREAGKPIAYLLGWREFHGRRFDVDESVLIPRPETELLVVHSLTRARHNAAILELGTGSGCIGITLACERADLTLTMTDGSAAALAMARRNARQHGVHARIDLRLSQGGLDWWSPIAASERFALVVSNPPYVARNDRHLREGDLRFEPAFALSDQSDDGLASLERIISGAPAHLVSDGWLLLEHGHDQGGALRSRLHDAGFVDVATRSDLAERDRVTFGRWHG